jgi:hypothetical protein
MTRANLARRMAVSLVLLACARAFPCQRDESVPPTWPLAARGNAIAAPTSFEAMQAVAAQPLIRTGSATVAPLLAAAPAASPALTFVRRDLSSSPFGQVTEGINVGDIDGDGRPDLVVGGDQYLLWYHNPDWTPNLIANGYKFAGGAMVVVRDMDGDGRLDVLTGRYIITDTNNRQLVWYGNTPSGWAPHFVSTTSYCHDMAFADFNGDGRADTACDDHKAKVVSWLQAPTNPTLQWTTHVVDSRGVMGADVADIDRDGKVDIVAGRAWYRNDGAGNFVRYPYTTLTDEADRFFDDYSKVNVLDLDVDGRVDVFVTLFANSREGQVWAFLAPPDPRTQGWTGVQIDPGPLFGVHTQAVARFDGTSRPQLMVAETNIGGYGFGPNPDPQIYLYRLVGSASDPAGWERTLVDHVGTHEGRAVDLNGDGFPDIAGGEENTDLVSPPRNGQVSWWQNTTGAVSGTTTTTPTGTTAPASTTTLPGGSQQVTLQPDAASGVDSQVTGARNATSNYGTGTSFCIGNDQVNSERALVHFDLSSVPAGAAVTSCSLTMTVRQVTAPTSGRILRLRRSDWSESGSTWNTFKAGAAWGTPGASSVATDVDDTLAVSFTPPSVVGAYSFPSLKGLCQDAVTARRGALDLLIRQDVDQEGACTGSCTAHEFCAYSSDFGTAASRPRLVVAYATGTATTVVASTTSTTTSTVRPSTTVVAGTTSTTTSTAGPATTLQSTMQPDPAGGVDDQMAGGRNTTGNYGTSAFLCVGNDQWNSERVLIHFDLSSLGNQASVTSCLLTFTVHQVTAPSAGRITRVRRGDWSETGASWTMYKAGAAWTAPGAGSTTTDVDRTLEVVFAPPVGVGAFTFPSLQALCQDAVRNRAGALDLVIHQDLDQNGACTGSCVPHEFCSRSSDYATAAARPKLVVGYVP